MYLSYCSQVCFLESATAPLTVDSEERWFITAISPPFQYQYQKSKVWHGSQEMVGTPWSVITCSQGSPSQHHIYVHVSVGVVEWVQVKRPKARDLVTSSRHCINTVQSVSVLQLVLPAQVQHLRPQSFGGGVGARNIGTVGWGS
jgi:hypothetical protein